MLDERMFIAIKNHDSLFSHTSHLVFAWFPLFKRNLRSPIMNLREVDNWSALLLISAWWSVMHLQPWEYSPASLVSWFWFISYLFSLFIYFWGRVSKLLYSIHYVVRNIFNKLINLPNALLELQRICMVVCLFAYSFSYLSDPVLAGFGTETGGSPSVLRCWVCHLPVYCEASLTQLVLLHTPTTPSFDLPPKVKKNLYYVYEDDTLQHSSIGFYQH